MIKIGITGNICSNYEEITNKFGNLGIPVFDADLMVRFLLHYDAETQEEIIKKFGNNSYNTEGQLNPKVFHSTYKMNILLDMIDLKLMRYYERFRLKNNKTIYTLFKFMLLYEREMEKRMDYTIHVYRPSAARIKDISKLPSFDRFSQIWDCYKVHKTEMCELDKNGKSTYTIHNYHNYPYTVDQQVRRIDNIIIEKYVKYGINDDFSTTKSILSY